MIKNDPASAGPAQSSSWGLYQPERLATIPLAAPPLRVALHAYLIVIILNSNYIKYLEYACLNHITDLEYAC